MTVHFKPRISWPKNELLLPPSYFGVSVPKGVDASDVRHPNFIDVAEMMRLKPGSSRSTSGGLSMTEGLVTAEPTIVFADPAKQWRTSPLLASDHGPWKFKFTGGDVFLDLKLGMFLSKTVEYDPKDDLSVQIFGVIYEHELLHVLDEIDIAKRWLPPHLLSEPTVVRYLVNGEPYVYGLARRISPISSRKL